MRLERVAYRYHRRSPWVLRDVTITLSPGRIVEVTGGNGAGKSTLLRLLAGSLRPRGGRIADRPGRVGYAPERFPADQPFTVRGYLAHTARIRRVPAGRGEAWAERLELTGLLDVPLPELSKGGAHKVGLAQALLADPRLLVLDEPFAGLDAAAQAALPAVLTELAAGGTTVVVSDHQRRLRRLPDIDRLRVAARTVGPAPAGSADDHTAPEIRRHAARDTAGRRAVIEVVVPADEAGTVVAKLRADGYDAREPRS